MSGKRDLLRVDEVEALLPHRPPILMLDRVVDIDPGVSGTGLRRFEAGDACFAGHFPGRALLPGVLAIEAFAQTLMVVMLAGSAPRRTAPDAPLGLLTRVDEMSFRRPIEPGQVIAFAVRVERRLGRFTIAGCRATRDGDLCAKGSLAVALERPEPEEGE